ncbi:ADP-ribosylation factor family protein [Hibiscus syriacus]|uniref:ADP-ribosylation factor family protein n=1 Tax=Hibiscus syriacus TaxID=106335 RepID=A0A6A2ZUA4_HIBSY|nr:ADP-ribosylation factor family protein [Hibiscus syriacus]
METEICISSMEFKVQELLKEVRLHYSPELTKLVDDTVAAIKFSLDKIPEDLQVTADWAPSFVRDIGADKAEFKFKKPESIEIGGSYSIGCVANPILILIFSSGYRRCLYLCVIKKYLQSSSSIQKVEWSTLQNEARKPVLVVYPAANLDEVPGLFIRIIPTATSLFNPSKLNVKRNNVRALNTGDVPQPTPIYNCSILEDMYLEDNSEFVKKLFSGWKELGEALILLKGNEQLNSSTRVNLAFRISNVAYSELQDEVALTLRCLEKSRDGGFEEIFATKVDNASRYDYCFRLNLKGNRDVYSLGFCLDDECWRVYEQDGLSALDCEPLFVGILVSSIEKAFRVVDIGPDAEKKDEALMFQNFGVKRLSSEDFKMVKLRKAQYEERLILMLTVFIVWESEQSSRHLILKRIVEFLLERHLSLLEKDIVSVVDQLDFSLLHDGKDLVSQSGRLLGAFEELSKRLHSIEDVPLRISSVQPLDSAFRYTSVFPPEAHPVANKKLDVERLHNLTPLSVQSLELEGSGNWPMDDVLIEKTKAVFLLKIAESLQDNWGMTCTASEEDVDVFMGGYAFRLRILHERGLSLVNKEIGRDQTKRVSAPDKACKTVACFTSFFSLLGRRGCGTISRLPLFEASTISCALFSDRWILKDNFTQSRKAYKENTQIECKAMFLVTDYDKSSEAWTRCSPNLLVGGLCSKQCKLVDKIILKNQTDTHGWECLFRTPLSLYDAVILLHGDRLPYPNRLLFTTELDQGTHVAHGNASNSFHPFLLSADMKGSLEQLKTKLMVNFDPLRCFVGDVEKEFSNVLKLWFDSLGGDAIGLTWERSKKRERDEEDTDGKYPVDLLRNIEVIRSILLIAGTTAHGRPPWIHPLVEPEAMDKTRHWKITGCTSYAGKGLSEGLDWLVQDPEARRLKEVFIVYEKASSQKMNFEKSCVFFSKGTSKHIKVSTSGTLGALLCQPWDIILGCPYHWEKKTLIPLITIGKYNTNTFGFLRDRVSERVRNILESSDTNSFNICDDMLPIEVGWRPWLPRHEIVQLHLSWYFPRCDISEAKQGDKASYAWNCIFKVKLEDNYVNSAKNELCVENLLCMVQLNGMNIKFGFQPYDARKILDYPITPLLRIWNAIGKAQELPKIRIIDWRICHHEAIPVGSSLRAISWGDGLCKLCNAADETVTHAFRDSQMAREVISYSLWDIRVFNTSMISCKDWLNNLLDFMDKVKFARFFALLWNLWTMRNPGSFYRRHPLSRGSPIARYSLGIYNFFC